MKIALDTGDLQQEDIDRSVKRILTSMYSIGLFDTTDDAKGDPLADVTSKEHTLLAREVAGKSFVILKNEKGLLPLNKLKTRLIGVFGDEDTVSGGGSGHVNPGPKRIITPLNGIKAAILGSGATAENLQLPVKNGFIAAAEFAKKCDVIVVVVATTSIEGYDRPSLALGNGM
jgi:beta-glucosidase